MSDLIERLRKDVSDLREKYSGPRSFVRIEDPRKFLFAMTDAADRIEALEKENAELRKAIEPFAKFYDQRHQRYVKRGGSFAAFPDTHPSFDIDADKLELPLGVWRRAYTALHDGGGNDSP